MRLQDVPMRTTLTLDDDVAARLQRVTRSTGRPFRAVVNEALRAGLEVEAARAPAPFEVTPFDLGATVDLDDIWGLIERLEGPMHR
ncbi:MAG: type II toxin-antitoxin system VapB family antitoxin [Chloroflexota bacterium]